MKEWCWWRSTRKDILASTRSASTFSKPWDSSNWENRSFCRKNPIPCDPRLAGVFSLIKKAPWSGDEAVDKEGSTAFFVEFGIKQFRRKVCICSGRNHPGNFNPKQST